jgi:hypothetical protein
MESDPKLGLAPETDYLVGRILVRSGSSMILTFGTGYGISHTGPANSVLYVACNQNVAHRRSGGPDTESFRDRTVS